MGVVRQAVGIPGRAETSICTFYEVRTFLPVEEIIDSRPGIVRQGGIAMDALTEWIRGKRGREASEALVERIPLIQRRDEEDFVMQNAVKTTMTA